MFGIFDGNELQSAITRFIFGPVFATNNLFALIRYRDNRVFKW